MPQHHTIPWPHAPVHRLQDKGVYMITAATMHKQHFYRTKGLLNFLVCEILTLENTYEWQLEAWAAFSNHYHFVGRSEATTTNRRRFFSHLHGNLSRALNRSQGVSGVKRWYNFWDKKLTYEKSYLARLNYVHQNAVKHGLVP